jgi:hypothetical protein
MAQDGATTSGNNEHHQRLTKYITYFVLVGFLIILIGILLIALNRYVINEKSEVIGKEWFTLFKDGFLILSGVLTTLIGYYFGNRGSDAALSQIQILKEENERILSNLETISPTDETMTDDIEPLGESFND